MKTVILDIDGTLSDLSHRQHHVRNGNRNWDAFFAEAGDDGLHEAIRDLAVSLAADHKIVLVSGRPERIRAITEDWMARHGVPYAELHMRPDGDYRQDFIVKSEILDQLLAAGNEIAFVIDDRPSVVAMWRERGLTCLQCREWEEFEKPGSTGLLTLMVGPSAAGKSTFLAGQHAREAFGIHPSHVLSSDQFRADLCGDFRNQSKNEQVFGALHAVARERLRHGLPTVLDATSIRRKDRMAAADLAKGAPVRYIVIDRPMDQKLRDAGWRADVRVKDKPLIEQHAATFGSQIKDILKGDSFSNVTVHDLRVL